MINVAKEVSATSSVKFDIFCIILLLCKDSFISSHYSPKYAEFTEFAPRPLAVFGERKGLGCELEG